MRIVGTIAVLPDIAVGGPRALAEVHKIGREVDEGKALAAEAEARVLASRARAKGLNRAHPDKANKLRHQANVIARQAAEHRIAANRLTLKRGIVATRDLGASYVATPVGTALFAASPPSNLLTAAQSKADAQFIKSRELHPAEPAGGMPRDVHLEMRMSSLSKGARR